MALTDTQSKKLNELNDKGEISKQSIWDPIVLENTNNFIGYAL